MTRIQAKQEIPQGWHGLIDRLFDAVYPLVSISDVKEKFGGLRISAYPTDIDTLSFIESLEEESLSICQQCGEPGTAQKSVGDWIRTLCAKHKKDFS